MLRFPIVVATSTVIAVAAAVLGSAPAASGSEARQDRLVNEVPSLSTMEVRDGRVQALVQVGDTIVVGGTFSKVADRGAGPVPRTYLAAYDRRTGRTVPGFAPVLNGQVWALAAGPVQGTVYVGGDFTRVNGVASIRVALLDVVTGERVPLFRSAAVNGTVRTLSRVGDRLYVGGVFTKVGGQPHGGLASLHARTGALDPFVDHTVSENHNYGRIAGAASSPVGVVDLAVTPDGRQLTAIGNFRKVDGSLHDQIVQLDLTGERSRVREDWTTSLFTAPCYYWAFDSWVRDVDYAPDGSYFVVGSTGGGNKDLCDVVARFDTDDRGTDVRPRWIASTGGDSIYSVAANAVAVYAGGHFRWFNNPLAVDKAGPGAVPRPGIAALDPATGMPLDWNPGRHPRDKGAFALLATDGELVVGTDTMWVGNKEYRTPRLAHFPLAGGAPVLGAGPPGLPGTLNGVTDGSVVEHPATASSVGPSGSRFAVQGLDQVRGATVAGDWIFLVTADGMLHRRAYDGGSRWGADVVLDPYNDPEWSDVLTGMRAGTETYRGRPSGFDAEASSLTSLFALNGQLFYTVQGSKELRARAFDAATGTAHPQSRRLGVSFPYAVSAATYAGGYVFWVAAENGALMRQGFDGVRWTSDPVLLSSPWTDGRDWRSQVLYAGRG